MINIQNSLGNKRLRCKQKQRIYKQNSYFVIEEINMVIQQKMSHESVTNKSIPAKRDEAIESEIKFFNIKVGLEP